MKLIVPKGSTSVSVDVFIRDNSVSTGVGLTGLAFNTASLTAYYTRQNAAATAITLATQTATGAYSSGGFVEVDGTNMPGLYRLDIPDAVLASGVNQAYIMLKGAANMEPCVIEIQLGVDVNATQFAGTAYATALAAEVDAIWDEQVDGSVTARQSVRLANSALAAKVSGLGTTSVAFRDLADSKDRITATVDADGNRSAVTRDAT